MFDSLFLFTILAQAEGAPKPDVIQPDVNPIVQFLPLIIIVFLFYLMFLRPQKREKAKRDETLKALKKNDRVVTIGGIIGSIANIEPDGNEVTLKVDDNTRIKMLRSSIQNVLKDEDDEQASK